MYRERSLVEKRVQRPSILRGLVEKPADSVLGPTLVPLSLTEKILRFFKEKVRLSVGPTMRPRRFNGHWTCLATREQDQSVDRYTRSLR